MAILQVRDVDNRLYAVLKGLAKREKRSLSQEVVHILESHLGQAHHMRASQTEEFLQLSGAFRDETAERLVGDIRKSRRNSRRFSKSWPI